jgi:hypothetical protein
MFKPATRAASNGPIKVQIDRGCFRFFFFRFFQLTSSIQPAAGSRSRWGVKGRRSSFVRSTRSCPRPSSSSLSAAEVCCWSEHPQQQNVLLLLLLSTAVLLLASFFCCLWRWWGYLLLVMWELPPPVLDILLILLYLSSISPSPRLFCGILTALGS